MEKSLTPLIAVLTLVVFLTIMVLNSTWLPSPSQPSRQESQDQEMRLRPSARSSIFAREDETRRPQDSFQMSKMLAEVKSLLAEGNEAGAENILRTILVFEPDNIKALSLLGGLLYYSGRYEEAEFIFRRQTQVQPSLYMAFRRLSSSQAKQGKLDVALDSGTLALTINPDSPEVNINLAGLYSLTGNKELAIQHFKKAYEKFGTTILVLASDTSFDNIRETPEFIGIVAMAESDLRAMRERASFKEQPLEPE